MSEERYIYVFIRLDLPLPLQLVHSCHAVHHMTKSWAPNEIDIPNVVMIGIRSEHSLKKVRTLLESERLPFFAWIDPDDDSGQTLSIATGPLTATERKALASYRLYSPGPAKAACGVTADGGANAAVAQEKEHPVFNRGVDSSILSGGSTIPNGQSS